MIKKEFKINDILNAVNRISKIERKKGDFLQTKKKLAERKDVLTLNNEVKSNKTNILVLNQMIE